MNCYLRTPNYADHLHWQTILFLTKARHDRFGENKAKEIRSLSADSLEVGFAKNVFSFQLHQLIEQLMFLKNQIEKLGEQIVFSGLYVSDEFTATKHKILQTRLTLSLAGYLVCCQPGRILRFYSVKILPATKSQRQTPFDRCWCSYS